MVSDRSEVQELAAQVVERDRQYDVLCNPKPQHVFVGWREATYKGSLQFFFGDRPDIAFLSKSNHPYADDLIEAIRRLDPPRQCFVADDDFDISGTKYMVDVDMVRLRKLSDSQTGYCKRRLEDTLLFDIGIQL